MATILCFPDQPRQPLKRSISLERDIAIHLAEVSEGCVELELREDGSAKVQTAILFEMLCQAARRSSGPEASAGALRP